MRFSPTASEIVIVCADVVERDEQPEVRAQDLRGRAGRARPSRSSAPRPSPTMRPDQMGRDTSPASNSIHTPAPTGGTVNSPEPVPAYGAAGSAQPVGISPRTSGTVAWSRPRFDGSWLFRTRPRYLP